MNSEHDVTTERSNSEHDVTTERSYSYPMRSKQHL